MTITMFGIIPVHYGEFVLSLFLYILLIVSGLVVFKYVWFDKHEEKLMGGKDI